MRFALLGGPFHVVATELDDFELSLGILVHELDLCTRELLSAADGDLGDGYLGERVLDEEHAILGDGAGRGDLAFLVDGEGGIGRDGVAVGGNGLAQGVLLAGLEALDDVDALVDVVCGLVILGRGPLLDDLALGVDDLNLGTFEFLTGGDVGLGDLDLGLGVLDQDVVVLDDGVSDLDLAVLVDGERGVGGDGVALGGDGLAQGVLLAGLEALDGVDALIDVLRGLIVGRRGPLLDNLALGVDDLDGRARNLLAVGDIHLGYLHDGLGVLDKYRVRVLDRGSVFFLERGHGAVGVELEDGVGGDGVARGGDGLAQGVGDARRQALDRVGLAFLGIPFGHDVLICIQNLDVRACDLGAACDIRLGHVDRSLAILDLKHVVRDLGLGEHQVVEPGPHSVALIVGHALDLALLDLDLDGLVAERVACGSLGLLERPGAGLCEGERRGAVLTGRGNNRGDVLFVGTRQGKLSACELEALVLGVLLANGELHGCLVITMVDDLVGDYETTGRVRRDGWRVTLDLVLGHGVGVRLAVLVVLVQILEREEPLSVLVRLNTRGVDLGIVLQQVDGNGLGTRACGLGCVIRPLLLAADGRLDHVLVGDGAIRIHATLRHCGVPRHFVLGNLIDNGHHAIHRGQTSPLCLIGIALVGHRELACIGAGYIHVVCPQVQILGEVLRARTLVVLVAEVVPRLGDLYVLGLHCVGDGVACSSGTGHFGRVTLGHYLLAHGILLCRVLVDRQVGERNGRRAGQRLRIVYVLALQQFHLNRGVSRPCHILALSIEPLLVDRDLGGLGRYGHGVGLVLVSRLAPLALATLRSVDGITCSVGHTLVAVGKRSAHYRAVARNLLCRGLVLRPVTHSAVVELGHVGDLNPVIAVAPRVGNLDLKLVAINRWSRFDV